MAEQNEQPVGWSELLKSATTEPGKIAEAFRAFHNYSIGNQMLAMFQCMLRKIPLGPMASYHAWIDKGRHVKKGEKALTLCMPITRKKKAEKEGEEDETFVRFLFKKNWFVLSQTEGPDLPPVVIPAWNEWTALEKLSITKVPFESVNGNLLGYARKREVSINPLAPMQDKVMFHEVAHILLGHTEEGMQEDGAKLPRNLKEAEAEAVTLLCVASLGLDGIEECRGYIQNWYHESEIPDKSATKIFKVADLILKAGGNNDKSTGVVDTNGT
jgi:hypothetical protein